MISSDLSQAKIVFPLHAMGKQHTIATSVWLKLKADNLFKIKTTWNKLHRLKQGNGVAQRKDQIRVVELCNRSEEASSWEASL